MQTVFLKYFPTHINLDLQKKDLQKMRMHSEEIIIIINFYFFGGGVGKLGKYSDCCIKLYSSAIVCENCEKLRSKRVGSESI